MIFIIKISFIGFYVRCSRGRTACGCAVFCPHKYENSKQTVALRRAAGRKENADIRWERDIGIRL